MTVHLEIEGAITNTGYRSHTVFVRGDGGRAGGFVIVESCQDSNGPNEKMAFSSWVESMDALEQFFLESGWVVRWPPRTVRPKAETAFEAAEAPYC